MVNETYNIEFNGRMRELRFGIGPSRILCEDRGIAFSDMHSIPVNELIQDIIYAALKFECLLKSEPIDFNKWEVYQWITEMDQETFQQIFEVFIKTRVVGKSVYDVYVKNLEEQNKAGEEQANQNSPDPEKKNKPGTT